MKRTDWLLCLAKNCDWFKFKIQKIQKNLNWALSSSMRLSSNRSQARTNQNARKTWVIIYRGYYTVARRYEFYVSSGKNNISWVSKARTSEILFLPREHKIHIFEPTCNNVLFPIFDFIVFQSSQVLQIRLGFIANGYSLKTFMSYKVFFFVFSFSSFFVNSLTSSSPLMDANLLAMLLF